MMDFLHHYLFPRESNNHRAKLLHHQSLLATIVVLLVLQIALVQIKTHYSNVLGIATDISSGQLLGITNKDREVEGLNDLTLNDQLSQAAAAKAADMFAENYWAHNSPDGVTPWVFIKHAGYDYVYAGENLARGFTTSTDVVDAWMASPSHRENMLSPNYKEVGYAVVSGKLLGEDTTLVVEEFGNKTTEIAHANLPKPANVATNPNVRSAATENPIISAVKKTPLFDSASLAWSISFMIVSLFIFVLLLDMILIERRKIARLVGHNIDHILFLGSILVFMIIFSRGVI